MSRYVIRKNEGSEVSNNPRMFDIIVHEDDQVFDNVVTPAEHCGDISHLQEGEITIEIKVPCKKKVELDLVTVLKLICAARAAEEQKTAKAAEQAA